MRIHVLLFVLICSPIVQGQDLNKGTKPNLPNPFESPPPPAGMMGGADEMMEMGMGGMEEMDMGMGGMGMDMDMDMDMGMGMMGAVGPEDYFRSGLQKAIRMLQNVKTDTDRKTLQNYIRVAFEERYDRMMQRRKQDLDSLRKGIEKLEMELKRRVEAKERVVQLQLQSVQLAAEGLLDASDLQGVQRSNGDEYGMEMGRMGMGGGN